MIGLHGHALNAAEGVGIEIGVEGAVGVDPRQVVALARTKRVGGPQLREISADHDLAVVLHRNGIDGVIGDRIEGIIEGAIRV